MKGQSIRRRWWLVDLLAIAGLLMLTVGPEREALKVNLLSVTNNDLRPYVSLILSNNSGGTFEVSALSEEPRGNRWSIVPAQEHTLDGVAFRPAFTAFT